MDTETLQQFYERTKQAIPEGVVLTNNASHVNVKQRTCRNRVTPYNRRDYYKICLIIGQGAHMANGKETPVNDAAIIFSNPSLPSSYRAISEEQGGFYCLFNDTFLLNSIRQEIRFKSALFNPSIPAVIELQPDHRERFAQLFSEMEALLESTYTYRFDMIRSLVQMTILEGIRLQGPVPGENSNERLISRFFELLNQQFPVDSPENPLTLLTPTGYADQLNIHVNHLNKILKKSTGKTTSDIIHERIVEEAKTLLINTDWGASEVAYSLGFEYPSHFNKYFKQKTQISPLVFRDQAKVLF